MIRIQGMLVSAVILTVCYLIFGIIIPESMEVQVGFIIGAWGLVVVCLLTDRVK